MNPHGVNLHPLPGNPDARWVDSAVCATTDPEIFFPERGQTSLPAKRICASCPVRLPCLIDGIEEEEGVWGGTNPDDRLALRQAIARHPARRDALLAQAARTLTTNPSTHLDRRNP